MDYAAIAANWRLFSKMGGAAQCAAVIKADAYGLGAAPAQRALAEAGCRAFFVASAGEGAEARAALGAEAEIFVLNGPGADDADLFAPAGLLPVLNSLPQIALWAGRGPAALHIDTGMNRLGLPLADLAAAAALLPRPRLVMSHLACASLPAHPMNARQLARFAAAAAAFPGAPRSLAATGGAQLGGAYHFEMLRIGLGLYGGADRANGVTLACAARITAPIVQVRSLAAGESVGYGAQFVAARPLQAATVALGYGDGCLRSLAGRGYGVLGGVKRPILGRVSMDLVVLDVSGAAAAEPEALLGAPVEFLGPEAPLDDVAQCAGTTAYEILTTFAGGVRRGERG